MLILSEQEIQCMYTMKDAISDVKEMLRRKQAGKVIAPDRTVLPFPCYDASILYMPSAEKRAAAVKVVSIFPHNCFGQLSARFFCPFSSDVTFWPSPE
ncbi:hypothetical protein GT94_17550 [Geobacillus stearothermophilus]|nr:hypothetical protein ET31_00275 [Geobacillus stearothermophilus]KFX31736.1 hypothetical protein GT94_17550 [Geobacillus stearothermophilus]